MEEKCFIYSYIWCKKYTKCIKYKKKRKPKIPPFFHSGSKLLIVLGSTNNNQLLDNDEGVTRSNVNRNVGQPKPKPSLKPELSQLGLKVAINITLLSFFLWLTKKLIEGAIWDKSHLNRKWKAANFRTACKFWAWSERARAHRSQKRARADQFA